MSEQAPEDDIPRDQDLAGALTQAVEYWCDRLMDGSGTSLDETLHTAKRRDRLAEQLRPLLKILFPGAKARHPETCPFNTRQSLRAALKKLDQIIGADPERDNALLMRVLNEGERRLGWKLPEALAVQLRLPRELPLVTADEIVGLTGLMRLRKSLDVHACGPARLDPVAGAGQILFSAIVDGGLLRKDLQQGFLRTLRCDLCVTPHGTWLSIPLDVPAPEVEEPCSRERWLVRPETELMLLRFWHESADNAFPQAEPWPVMKAYFAAAGVPVADRPASLAVLNRWARTSQALILPPFLRETATGRFHSTGVNDSAHRRLCTGERVFQADDARLLKGVRRHEQVAEHPHPAVRVPVSIESRRLTGIVQVLRAGKLARAEKRNRILRGLSEAADHLGYVGWLIGQWCANLLKDGRKALKLSAIIRYVYPVKRYVLPAFAGTHPASLTDEQWEERFQDALDRANDGLAPLAIYSFAQFVVAQPDGPQFDPNELEGVDSIARVSANLVSVRDFEASMDALTAATPRDTRMARLVAALGFYCGLRRGEAMNLRLGDLNGVYDTQLFVRGHPDHTVKRVASQRVLPLQALLPAHWLSELHAWRLKRDAEGRSESTERLLFCRPGKDFDPIPADELIIPVRDALRATTGDYGLVYHHLRHAFANWTLLRLLSVELPMTAWQQQLAALIDPWFAAPACRTLRRAILGSGIDDEPARHAAYALARLMGHAEVATTLRHYVHIADLLALGYQTQRRALRLPDAQVRSLLGLGDSEAKVDAAYHRWRRIYKKAWDDTLGGLRPEVILDTARRMTLGYDSAWPTSSGVAAQTGSREAPAAMPRALQLDDIPAVIGAVYDDRLRVNQAAAQLNLRPEQVHAAKMAVVGLGALRTKDGHHPRFHMPPTPPSGAADGDLFRQAIDYIETHPLDMKEGMAGIDLLVRADPHRGHRIILSSDEDALRFAALLQAIGFGPSRLHIDLYPRADAEEENRTHWCRRLGVRPQQVAIKPHKRVGPGAPNGEIAIHVLSRRRRNRLDEATGRCGGDYEPTVLKRGLVWLRLSTEMSGIEWVLPQVQSVADLVAVLRALGVPEERVRADATDLRVAVEVTSAPSREVVERGVACLVNAKVDHALRVVSSEEDDIVAVVRVLRAWGVSPDLMHLDYTGDWECAARAVSTAHLLEHAGMPAERIETKPRKGRPARLSFAVVLARGSEQIKSWSLTYTLIMLYVLAKSTADLPEAGAP